MPETIFGIEPSEAAIYQAVRAYLTNQRQGNASTKTRAQVDQTKRKIYRQKGTGRARHGIRRAPIFVGGGVAHGPKPRSYRKDMPRKMRRAAIRSALSAKASAGDIVVLEHLEMERPKTKDMVEVLDRLTGVESTLVLVADRNENIEKSSRNLANVKALRANYLNIRDILGHQKIVMPIPALELILGFLGQGDAVPTVTAVVTTEVSEEEEE